MRKTPAIFNYGSDARLIVPFLSATCSALWEQGWITENEADQFRHCLKSQGFSSSQESQSLLELLLREKSPVLDHIQETCGIQSFQDTVIRWTLSHLATDLALKLRDFTKILIQKAELLFNQNFYIYENEACEKISFFSFYLIELANNLFAISSSLLDASSELKQLASSSSWNSKSVRAFEINWAKHLGFEFLEERGFRSCGLTLSLRQIVFDLESVYFLFESFLSQARLNTKSHDAIDAIAVASEDWRGTLEHLRSVPLTDTDSWQRLEHRRQTVIACIETMKDLMGSYQSACLTLLKTTQVDRSPKTLAESDFRELMGALLDKGIAAKEAKSAIEKLRNYCASHNVDPRQLLEAELTRIHSSLNFEILVSLRADSLAQYNSQALLAQKARVISQKDLLIQALSSTVLVFLFLLPALTILCVSCGVKTAPRSEVLDLRPSLPYHAEHREVPTSEQGAAKPHSD